MLCVSTQHIADLYRQRIQERSTHSYKFRHRDPQDCRDLQARVLKKPCTPGQYGILIISIIIWKLIIHHRDLNSFSRSARGCSYSIPECLLIPGNAALGKYKTCPGHCAHFGAGRKATPLTVSSTGPSLLTYLIRTTLTHTAVTSQAATPFLLRRGTREGAPQ